MAQRPDPTERAARILAERSPEDRLDAFMMLTGQEYLWRMQGPERDSPGADFAEAVSRYEAKTGRVLARQTHPPTFGAVRYYRPDRTREVAVWLGGRLLDWITTRERGRPADAIWLIGILPVVLGRSYREACAEPPRPLADAERRITELAYVHLVEPGAGDGA